MLTIPPCELLVVGAGPAGCSAAIAAASRGVPTLLIDAKTRIGEPSHCGEFVPARLFVEYRLDRACIMNRVEFMETRVMAPDEPSADSSGYPQGEEIGETVCTLETRSSGYIVDRVRFDRDLARAAAAERVLVLCAARLLGHELDGWVFRHNKVTHRVHPRLVIAADGAASTVASVLGMSRPVFLRGVQVEAPLITASDRCLIYLDRGFVGGYGWVFPKKSTANVGLGTAVKGDVSPVALLEGFLTKLIADGVIGPGRLTMSAGLIPVSGMRSELVKGNVLFCGDAAGLTHPITGAGIPQAVVSGSLAGRFAAEALQSGSEEPLMAYQKEIRSMYKGVVDHALAKREVLNNLWDDLDFVRLCEKTWIAFKGYRHRVRFWQA
jgi:digeranylgeranylglycerophospholipid reductase